MYIRLIALIGPRQCGKSTLVKHILENYPNSIYLDMERPSDLHKLDGAIKLTDKMSQRKHTIKERDKMNMCLQYLKENGINDNKGITETIEFD